MTNFKVICFAVATSLLFKIINPELLQDLVHRNILKFALKKIPLISILAKCKLERLALSSELVKYRKGQCINYRSLEEVEKMFVVLEGTLTNAKGDNSSWKRGQLIQEENVFSNRGRTQSNGVNMMKRSTSTQDEFLLAETDCVLAEVTKPLFKKCNDESNRDSEYISLLEQIKSLKPLTAYVIIEDFVYIRSIKLGSGMKFYLIKYKNCLYSLKIIPQVKDPADTDLQLIQIAREEEVLKMVNHPCTIKYIITMIDKDQTRYFLSEFCPGEDLNLVLQELGFLDTFSEQFYSACLISIAEYLHSLNIIYRYFKPDNILVGKDGYLKFVNFEKAKYLKPEKNGSVRTYTVTGAPHYTAPEIVAGKGYGLLSDIWSIGICMYEIIFASVPFGDELEDPYAIYEEILSKPLKFPKEAKDKKVVQLLKQLLSKKPEERMPSSFAGLKSDPFFEGFNWSKFDTKEMQPPYKPPKDQMVIPEDELKKIDRNNRKLLSEVLQVKKLG